jgi:hypothetical protein
MVYNSTITFNGVLLRIDSITRVKNQKTVKQQIGRSIAQIPILGLSSQQYELQVTGYITGTTTSDLDTNRAALEALDIAMPYQWIDGIHTAGTYIMMPGSLKFDDSGEKPLHYTYSFSLVQQ